MASSTTSVSSLPQKRPNNHHDDHNQYLQFSRPSEGYISHEPPTAGAIMTSAGPPNSVTTAVSSCVTTMANIADVANSVTDATSSVAAATASLASVAVTNSATTSKSTHISSSTSSTRAICSTGLSIDTSLTSTDTVTLSLTLTTLNISPDRESFTQLNMHQCLARVRHRNYRSANNEDASDDRHSLYNRWTISPDNDRPRAPPL
ncbi:uncharacterized protein PgNI_09063 [Pyricularia grisea]|uniref:Uncharacterized protein n=1 Tax=Pyricularia grisea TaxID=148305 RepID=A0A6P8AT33_PYRGI|nr:uncharacterized protein PgNI_09063 [Pyricularia grisea]TLD05268.1 hypothetical protein PgNI_09063 [Pyricularia grisea]